MKNIHRECLILAAACFMSQIAICDEAVSNAVAAIDAQLANCVSALPNGDRGCPLYMMEFGMPDGRRGSPEYIREFGVPLRRCPSYQDLVGLVSSNQDYLRLGKKCAEVDSGGRSALALSLCVNLIH